MDIFIYDGPSLGEELAYFSNLPHCRVFRCSNMLELKMAVRAAKFPFKTQEGMVQLFVGDIDHFRVTGHHLSAHLVDGTVYKSPYLRISAREFLLPLLSSEQFMESFRGTYVNVDQIFKLTEDEVLLYSGASLPVSQKYYASICKRLLQAEARCE